MLPILCSIKYPKDVPGLNYIYIGMRDSIILIMEIYIYIYILCLKYYLLYVYINIINSRLLYVITWVDISGRCI